MRKLPAALAVVGLTVVALSLASCGGGSDSGGKEGGTLRGTYASFAELDPTIAYTAEGLTAMYNTYLPLLTYAHANGQAGTEVVPALAQSLPKISKDGKTYTLTLRKGLKYSDGAPVKASDFASTIERIFKLNSPGSSFYTAIVGAEKFAETKSGGIPGIETDDKTGEIVIHLTQPRGTFTNELALLYSALLPSDTPAKNLTADPAPATGPYAITKSEPGRGWSYVRNPQWAKTNGELMPDLPSGHVDKIEISVVRNKATSVNEIERGKSEWMQSILPADLYNKVKDKFEGTQFRVEQPINLYYFWMNTSQPPFDDLKVRQAVNYAVDTAALERIYSGSLVAAHQVLPKDMPGHEPFDLYPHDMAKAKELLAQANPADRDITVWTDNESPNDEAGAYYQDVLSKLGFNAKLKTINADVYFQLISNTSTPDLDTGWTNWFADYPHPNDYFQLQLSGESIAPIGNTNLARIDDPKLNAKISKLAEEQLGPGQEDEYAEMDREFMEQAPWTPYGTNTVSTFVSSDINLDEVIFNPTFGQDLTSFQFK
ncbi:MAG TPA: ABC transporter substrate-binding protein [Solirubrobacterales bacterium]|nr:ABC transporter substrate-binding protein [Solirubrobacterales bacterium]